MAELDKVQFADRTQLLQACIHCGLCLEQCPTYLVSGEEMSSPRGRIHLMKAVEDGSIDPQDEIFQKHEASCLVCRSCETACPSGVQFGVLMEQTREIINEQTKPHWFRKFIYTKLIGSRSIAVMMQFMLLLFSKARFVRLLTETFDLKKSPLKRFAASLELLPENVPFPSKRLLIYRTQQARRGSVGMLIGCIGDQFSSSVNDATINVLNRLGYDVHTIPQISCCGALASHSGFGDHARELALSAISAIESADIEYFITNIAGCGAMMKDYEKLFSGTPDLSRAQRVRGKMRDISEFLLEFHHDDIRNLNIRFEEKTSIGYHAPCHLYHGQQITDAPRELLSLIKNAEVFALEENTICCGSAGTYNIEHPEMADALLDRKMEIIKTQNPNVVATANAGCLMQLQKGLRQQNSEVKVRHAIEILQESMSRK
ncbi:MAG: heterodisulfide reductase-related iron-sulfur binding cluster [bacterium]